MQATDKMQNNITMFQGIKNKINKTKHVNNYLSSDVVIQDDVKQYACMGLYLHLVVKTSSTSTNSKNNQNAEGTDFILLYKTIQMLVFCDFPEL